MMLDCAAALMVKPPFTRRWALRPRQFQPDLGSRFIDKIGAPIACRSTHAERQQQADGIFAIARARFGIISLICLFACLSASCLIWSSVVAPLEPEDAAIRLFAI